VVSDEENLGERGACGSVRFSRAPQFPLILFFFFFLSTTPLHFSLQVRCYVGDNEQRWYLWYSARSAGPPAEGRITPPPAADAVSPGAGAVGLARSADGVVWTRGPGADTPWAAGAEGAAGGGAGSSPPPVLGPNPDDWWWHDTAHVTVSDVQILSSGGVAAGAGVYWMFYAGGCWEGAAAPPGLPLPPAAAAAAAAAAAGGAAPGDAPAATNTPLEGLRTRAGLALSQDGVHWARVEGADHHTGAVLDAGEGDGWDAAFVGAPQVVAAGPRDLRLYYHSFDGMTGKWTVGLARSADGLKWERWGGGAPGRGMFSGGGAAHDAGGAAARHVVRDTASGAWVMAYEAVAADGTRSIGAAVSGDGLTGWVAAPLPLLSAGGEPGAWDAGGVGGPCLVPMAGGRWRLYYSGRRRGGGGGACTDGRWCGVGLALSAEEEGEGGGGGLPGLAGAPAFPASFVRREGAVPEGVEPVV